MLSKAVPLVAGTIYLVGYFVIARYLADYGVPVTQLVSAQYLIAGMPPGVLLWFTLAVGYSAYRYAPKGEGRAQVGSYGAMAQVYTAIPQAYGGGKPLIVQLYVEREKAPLELLASNTAGEKTPMV